MTGSFPVFSDNRRLMRVATLLDARAFNRNEAYCLVAAGGVVGGTTAGVAAGRTRGSQRPFTMRIFRALHLRTAARTLAFDTQMPSIS